MATRFDIQGMGRIVKKILGIWILSAALPLLAQERFQSGYLSVGEDFKSEEVLTRMEMENRYSLMQAEDSLMVNFRGVVSSVCQQKGCWMTLALQGDQEVMVRFKDYAFFVPKDIKGQTVIINGKAFVSEMSVDQQRHYAEDEGLPEESINSINSPKRTFSFLASGVKIEQEP